MVTSGLRLRFQQASDTTAKGEFVSQHYSDPSRADDPHALLDVEVFWSDGEQLSGDSWEVEGDPIGWFWRCLPNGDPNGPFATEAEAIADTQELE